MVKVELWFMGRTPDYKATFTGSLGPYSDFYKGFEDNAKRWYEKTTRDVPFCNHTIINPAMDRNKPQMSGLRYRIKRLEELLSCQIRNPKSAFQLYASFETLLKAKMITIR
ncbi:4-hydroxyphenylacetate 3-hydroxylase N-terminal domain-containing protein [Peribacillus frigoritolerans]|jgi:4-hydroxyphenylacetate 3-monooxygenase|uniref:4-hydroxyphenylacetate 3-hydroxylase N-terminal domain-containing protein n=1 Tax=Peribacillus frigoritolerans TaxID=450367 RepID=UPI0035154232